MEMQIMVDVVLVDGERVRCANPEDAALVRDADQRLYEGEPGRKLPGHTLAALERAGLNANNSVLYRSVLGNLEDGA
jgi:hypothetical protein